MTVKYIKPIDAETVSLEMIGGKGKSLARMASAGMPVPGGFYLTTSAYKDFVEENNLQEDIINLAKPEIIGKTVSFDSASKRIQELIKGVSIDYNGQYYKLKKAYFSPPCTQKPHVPIMVGGNGEKRTLRTLARFGDIANIDFNQPGSPELFKHKMEVIERHCEEFSRDPSEIKKTVVIPLRIENDEKETTQLRRRLGKWCLYGTIPSIIDRIQQYIDAGAEEIIFSMSGGVRSKPEQFEQTKEEIISAFS